MTIGELRKELDRVRQQCKLYEREVETMRTEVEQKSIRLVRDLTTRVRELLAIRDHNDSEMDDLLDKLRASQEQVNKVQKEKRESLKSVRNEFVSVLEVAKQEV